MKFQIVAASAALILAAPGLAAAATFGEVDADKDGMITRQEFAAALPPAEEAKFQTLDADGDGQVSLSELLAMDASGSAGAELEAADADSDGFVSYQEYGAWHEARTEAYFSGADANGDGMISEAEAAN